MEYTGRKLDFPRQRIPTSQKTDAWGAQSADWIIAQAVGMKDVAELDKKYGIIQGELPHEDYAKTLNPYNSKEEKYTFFPATMRNYDLIKGVIRRYVSEYLKAPHDFIVGANNSEVMLARNAKLKAELNTLVEQQIAGKIQENYAAWVNEGNDPAQFNPQEAIDINAFIEKFNEDYVDSISAQGQEILDVVRDITEDALLYSKVYYDFVAFGECYTYSTVENGNFKKEHVSAKDAYPVSTDNFFKEDDDAFCRLRKLTDQQIIDEFGDYFTDEQLKFIDDYYGTGSNTPIAELTYTLYHSYFPSYCDRFSAEERNLFTTQPLRARDTNVTIRDVWHCVWRGEIRRAQVTFVNEISLLDVRIEDDDYVLDPSIGDVDIEYFYEPQVYEAVRIGTRNTGLYPYGARAIAFNRGGKLPYNGVNELLPGFGKFSVVEIMYQYNVFYNIVAYHREMAIAKNKLSILMIAKSLLGAVPEDTIYKMLADGVIYFDDSDDQGMLRAQQTRMLVAGNYDYIDYLGKLLSEIETSAKNQVDMTPQRFGEIAASAGKGTTDEAINRGSMGSVIIEFIMNSMRERDYARDMDFTKLAWIDGLDTSYRDSNNNMKYISLDIDSHVYASYLIKAKDSVKEKEKMETVKQLLFSASQNGDFDMALAAVQADNVGGVVTLAKKYKAARDAQEENLKAMDQQLAQMEQQFEVTKIQTKGAEDRKLEELKGIIDQEIELIKADANMVSFDNGVSENDKQAGMQRLEDSRNAVVRDKQQIDREKNLMDAFSKSQDRRVKEKDIDTKLKIAQTNRNKYDSKGKK